MIMGIIKHTRECIEPIIKDSKSIREALYLLGLKPEGGNKRLRELIKDIILYKEYQKAFVMKLVDVPDLKSGVP